MLSEKIQSKINRELKKYPADQKQSAVMAALRFVQDEKGWIAPEDMADIAAYIGMPQMAVPSKIQRGGRYRTHDLRSESGIQATSTPPQNQAFACVAMLLQRRAQVDAATELGGAVC